MSTHCLSLCIDDTTQMLHGAFTVENDSVCKSNTFTKRRNKKAARTERALDALDEARVTGRAGSSSPGNPATPETFQTPQRRAVSLMC